MRGSRLAGFIATTAVMLCWGLNQRHLPEHILVGYWHNFNNAAGTLLLNEIPLDYDVINIAFAEPVELLGSTMHFSPDPSIYPDENQFIEDIQYLQLQGRKVNISIGGANGPIHLENEIHTAEFVSSMITIIDTYGFDGLDIDLEGQSLFLEAGDTDINAPTSPLIVHFSSAVLQLSDHYGENFLISAAPETAYVQGGVSYYGGIWGAYLPVLAALRDRLTYIHVQHYNTGSMWGLDGQLYQPATADFQVMLADMLLTGFTVPGATGDPFFAPFEPEQVAFGLPAAPGAAGSGFTSPNGVLNALGYIIEGTPFGGNYILSSPDGFPEFRGLMTWSINWDMANNWEFSASHGSYLHSFNDTDCDLLGDVNGDTEVNILDVVTLVNAILGFDPAGFLTECADLNNDNSLTVQDIVILVNVITGNR